MSDTGRKDVTDKAAEKVTPESEKSVLDKAKETATDAGDKVAKNVQPSDEKSVTQKLSDSTSGGAEGKGIVEQAEEYVKAGVEYVQETANDVYNKVADAAGKK
ncbi:hypothetical protein MMC21_006500 [Puttea exsequens]|nr:hypothetical protein [Puttea exsequens]